MRVRQQAQIDCSSMTTARTTTPINRRLIYISLGLALLLVVGVLAGSKLVVQRFANQPVALSPLPAPMAESKQCAELVSALPERIAGHKRAELAEPAPAGAAVWQSSSTERITLRCGVDMPLQYTELTSTFSASGAQWMKVTDPSGTGLATWFTVDRSPVVAVTADKKALGQRENPVEEFSAETLSALAKEEPSPAPAPLATLAEAEDYSADDCSAFVAALPEQIAEGYDLLAVEQLTGEDPTRVRAWGGDGLDPVVVRCGVAEPESYEPGAFLTQVNEVPWFEDTDTTTGTGTTLYALGRTANIALALPAGMGDEALNNLSAAIAKNVPEQT